MRIYDISQEVFSCSVFPGDIEPKRLRMEAIENGSLYNLTGVTMCAHNGTHVDAPYHFYQDGKTIDLIALDRFIGKCYVTHFDGEISDTVAEMIIQKAKDRDIESAKRILIGGDCVVTLDAAKSFARGTSAKCRGRWYYRFR